MKYLATILAGWAAFAAASCDPDADLTPRAPKDRGSGLSAVEKTYGLPAPEMMAIVGRALQSFDLSVDYDERTPMGGALVAHHAGGHEVTAKIGAVDGRSTRVSIRVTPGDHHMAELIHDRVARIMLEEPTAD